MKTFTTAKKKDMIQNGSNVGAEVAHLRLERLYCIWAYFGCVGYGYQK